MDHNQTAGSGWMPSLKSDRTPLGSKNALMRMLGMPLQAPSACPESLSQSDGLANGPITLEEEHDCPVASLLGVRVGFAGPDDRVVSLDIPALGEGGKNCATSSFGIEYDPEQSDKLMICLQERDQDGFIHTVQKSYSIPLNLLTELLGRRKATEQEVAAWQSMSGEED